MVKSENAVEVDFWAFDSKIQVCLVNRWTNVNHLSLPISTGNGLSYVSRLLFCYHLFHYRLLLATCFSFKKKWLDHSVWINLNLCILIMFCKLLIKLKTLQFSLYIFLKQASPIIRGSCFIWVVDFEDWRSKIKMQFKTMNFYFEKKGPGGSWNVYCHDIVPIFFSMLRFLTR